MSLCNQENIIKFDPLSKNKLNPLHDNFNFPLLHAKMTGIDFNTSAESAWQHSLQLSINGDGNMWDLNSNQNTIPKSHQHQSGNLAQLTSTNTDVDGDQNLLNNNGHFYKNGQVVNDQNMWNQFANTLTDSMNVTSGQWSPSMNMNAHDDHNGNNESSNWMNASNVNKEQITVESQGQDQGQKANGANSSPIPINERSLTEPLWQRRLNAKNRELEHLHVRMSAPELQTTNLDSSSLSKGMDEISTASIPSSSFSGVNGDHDFAHASPDTMRMLSLDMNMMNGGEQSNENGKSIHNNDFVDYSTTNDQCLQHMPMSGTDNSSQKFIGDYQYSSNVSYVDPFSGNMIPHLAAGMQTINLMKPSVNGMPNSYADQKRSPQFYGQAILTNGAKTRRVRGLSNASMKQAVEDLASTATNQESLTSPKSANSMHLNGNNQGSTKGVISKVIVPPAPGTQSDAVDVRTGEAGQMRHMCPHPGCDKHFSTSGHARRHSRIHDCLKPFECPHPGCQATFTRRDNCTQHQRARHRFQLVAHRIGGDE